MKNPEKIILLLIIALFMVDHRTASFPDVKYRSDALEIHQVTPHIFLHTSYLDIPGHGKFPCNGMVFQQEREAVVFDTPSMTRYLWN